MKASLGLVFQTSSLQKGSESRSGRPATKERSIEKEVAAADIKGNVDNVVQVNDRRATRNATAASKEKAKEKPSTLETVRQKVRKTMGMVSI